MAVFDILSKLHMLDMHALAGGGVSRGIQGLIVVNCIVNMKKHVFFFIILNISLILYTMLVAQP